MVPLSCGLETVRIGYRAIGRARWRQSRKMKYPASEMSEAGLCRSGGRRLAHSVLHYDSSDLRRSDKHP